MSEEDIQSVKSKKSTKKSPKKSPKKSSDKSDEKHETHETHEHNIEDAKFCRNDYTLLEEAEKDGKLVFKCFKDGQIYEANAFQTRLVAEDYEASESSAKFENAITYAPYDNTIPWVENKCEKCERTLVKMLRLGEQKKVVYVCLCGEKRFN